MSNGYNVILIQLDSLNRHFLRAYGNTWIDTPNLTAFAQQAAVFDAHYVGSLPCMPARREIWAGTQEFWWRPWGPLEPWDVPIAKLAREQGVVTQYITDHYHMFEWGSHSYHYDFHGYEFIRGHEIDNWKTAPVPQVPPWAQKMVELRGEWGRQYLQNVADFTAEADFFAPKVMQATADWLEHNHSLPQFFLHVDSFDVHEPFHVPEPYRSMYTDQDYRQHNPFPRYGRVDEGLAALSLAEVEWVRAQFAGKLTMVDRWLGRVFDKLTEHRLLDRTVVIISTDHGHYLGDHGWIGKPNAPMYHTLCHIPLLIWHPAGAHNGQRVSAITQTVDLYATVLEALGAVVPEQTFVHSRSLVPVLRGEANRHRDYAVYGYCNSRMGLTNARWTLLRDHNRDAAPPEIYTTQLEQIFSRQSLITGASRFAFGDHIQAGASLPGVPLPVYRVRNEAEQPSQQRADLLFDNLTDPDQAQDLAAQAPAQVAALEAHLRDHLRALQVPENQWRRLRLED
ncbi:MAG: sulfatase [Anaerolineae bacterium]|nr:sulfatase [Anaerolineae bacterium]